MVTSFSFALGIRRRSSDWLRYSSFGGHVHCSLLLGSSSISFSRLSSQCAQCGLALGFGLLQLFGLSSSFGLIFLGFGELFLRVSGLISFLQFLLLLFKQSSILRSFLLFCGFSSSLSLGFCITKPLLCSFDFKTVEFSLLGLLGANLGIRLTRFCHGCLGLSGLGLLGGISNSFGLC